MIPIDLIVNEAVSNSFKDAFPGRSGVIDITFVVSGACYLLKIKDHGVGLPDQVQTRGLESFEIHPIKALSDQLSVELSF